MITLIATIFAVGATLVTVIGVVVQVYMWRTARTELLLLDISHLLQEIRDKL